MSDDDYKLYYYRCDECGGREWVRKIPKGERKVRGYCKEHRQFVTAYNVKSVTNSERAVRVTKIKPLW